MKEKDKMAYELFKQKKWIPTKNQMKRMEKNGYKFPKNQETVSPRKKSKYKVSTGNFYLSFEHKSVP